MRFQSVCFLNVADSTLGSRLMTSRNIGNLLASDPFQVSNGHNGGNNALSHCRTTNGYAPSSPLSRPESKLLRAKVVIDCNECFACNVHELSNRCGEDQGAHRMNGQDLPYRGTTSHNFPHQSVAPVWRQPTTTGGAASRYVAPIILKLIHRPFTAFTSEGGSVAMLVGPRRTHWSKYNLATPDSLGPQVVGTCPELGHFHHPPVRKLARVTVTRPSDLK
jgi:hypothetical protein